MLIIAIKLCKIVDYFKRGIRKFCNIQVSLLSDSDSN